MIKDKPSDADLYQPPEEITQRLKSELTQRLGLLAKQSDQVLLAANSSVLIELPTRNFNIFYVNESPKDDEIPDQDWIAMRYAYRGSAYLVAAHRGSLYDLQEMGASWENKAGIIVPNLRSILSGSRGPKIVANYQQAEPSGLTDTCESLAGPPVSMIQVYPLNNPDPIKYYETHLSLLQRQPRTLTQWDTSLFLLDLRRVEYAVHSAISHLLPKSKVIVRPPSVTL